MTTQRRLSACAFASAAAFAVVTHANAPAVYAIRGARLVTAAGAPVASGTIVLRNGLIDAVGADVQAPPDAVTIDGTGMTVYPGLIDMGNSSGLDVEVPADPPDNLRTSEEAERWKRGVIFRPDLAAAEHVRPDSPELARLAQTGITTVLATPPGVIVKGQSALVNVAAPPDDPQIGAVADPRKGLQIVRTPVALHVEFPGSVQFARGRAAGYPVSLLGAIAFVRQSFLDAQHQQLAEQRYEKRTVGVTRPVFDPALDALQPALAGRLPVAFEAGLAREIRRALDMAQEFKLDPVITGGLESDQVAADLKARNARVIYSLNFPARSRLLPPDADEPVRELRARAQAPKTPAALAKAGVPFAFASSGLKDSKDFLKHAALAVKEGLAPDAAIRALTIDAAKIAGAGDRLGSLEKGKIANLVVADGDLFGDKTTITHVFVDGRPVAIEAAPAQNERRGGRH